MLQYFVHIFSLAAVVSAQNGGYNYASVSASTPQVQLTPPAAVPVAIALPSEPVASYTHKEYYTFTAPAERTGYSQNVKQLVYTKIRKHMLKKASSHNVPKSVTASQQHFAEPAVHYISYKTPAEAQQLLQQIFQQHGGGKDVVGLSKQLFASNVGGRNLQTAATNVNRQDIITPIASNVNEKYLPPPPTVVYVNKKYTPPVVSTENSPFFHTPAATNVKHGYLPPPPAVSHMNVRQSHTSASVNQQYLTLAVLDVPLNVHSSYHTPAASNINQYKFGAVIKSLQGGYLPPAAAGDSTAESQKLIPVVISNKVYTNLSDQYQQLTADSQSNNRYSISRAATQVKHEPLEPAASEHILQHLTPSAESIPVPSDTLSPPKSFV